jgi:ribonuclease Z
MNLSVMMLGTSSMVPTRERNTQAVLLEYEGEFILLDCGEGTQRQMNIAGYSRAKIRKILISHWHGDHVGGLIGLIQTVFNSDYQHTLHIYGPRGSQERVEHLRRSVDFENDISLEVHELEPQPGEVLTFFENDDYELRCAAMRHSTPTIGFAFCEKDKRKVVMTRAAQFGLKTGPLVGKLQRGETVDFKGVTITPEDVCTVKKGRKVVLVPDTTVSKTIPALADEADLLIIESTYANAHETKADEHKHLTAGQAALLASQAGVKKLLLTHFSQRYTELGPLLEDARVHYPGAELAHDFMRVTL